MSIKLFYYIMLHMFLLHIYAEEINENVDKDEGTKMKSQL
jgi:hypothetical protein